MHSECLSWKNEENSQNRPTICELHGFLLPRFRELTRESAFVWFGLPERLLMQLLQLVIRTASYEL